MEYFPNAAPVNQANPNQALNSDNEEVLTPEEASEVVEVLSREPTEFIHECKSKSGGTFEFVIQINHIIKIFKDFIIDNNGSYRLDISRLCTSYNSAKDEGKKKAKNKNKKYVIDYTRSFTTKVEAIEYRDHFLESLDSCIYHGYMVPEADIQFVEDFFKPKRKGKPAEVKEELLFILRNGAIKIRDFSDQTFTFSYIRSAPFGEVKNITALGTHVDFSFLNDHYKKDFAINRDRSPFSYHRHGAPLFRPSEPPRYQIPIGFSTDKYEPINVHFFARLLKNGGGPCGFVVWTWRFKHELNNAGLDPQPENTARNVRRRRNFVETYRAMDGVEKYYHFVYYMHSLTPDDPGSSTWFQYISADPGRSEWDYLCG